MKANIILLSISSLLVSACSDSDNSSEDNQLLEKLKFPETLQQSARGNLRVPETGIVSNPEAVIPPQCYTKHENKYNPCMTCHQSYDYRSRPNSMNDGGLQQEYAFSDVGLHNHWSNLFEDRSSAIQAISDQQVIDYIYTDNYSTLIQQLKESTLNVAKIQAADVYELTTPGIRRALDLNKAYMTIVQQQDFINGRDANLKPAENVYRRIDPDTPIFPADKTRLWDLRLNWGDS